MDIRTPIPTNGGDWLTKFGETWKAQAEALRQKFGGAIEEIRMPPDYPTDVPIVYVRKEAVAEVLAHLKSDPAFEYGFLSDITATDEMTDPRFEVVYNLFSHVRFNRIRVKVRARDGEAVPTASSVWPAANWAEREVFDMFGIRFEGHPDLRRILMDERWVGHPLRKDYPLKGYQIFTDAEVIHPELLDKG
ncbi:MAG: NADH-quinone oxidoreductase subunit C [Oligoflexia bacterium]|nr:NADH-quinone oxidoreductase subunit C [Oligoflexia bacterium]